MGAQPSGAPGWPLLAFSTVSTARSRRVSMESVSSEVSVRLESFGWNFSFRLKCGPHPWNSLIGVNLDFNIVSKPGVLLGPMEGPFHCGASGSRGNIRAEPGAAQAAAQGFTRCLPAVVGPNHGKKPLVQDAQGASGDNFLNRPPLAVNFHIAAKSLPARRLAIAFIHGVDAVENLAILSRAQQLEVLRVRPDQRHSRPCGLPPPQARTRFVRLVPDLLRQHLAAGGKRLIGLYHLLKAVACRQFVVRAFASEQRPDAPLTPALKRPAIRPLPVAVAVVPQPARR